MPQIPTDGAKEEGGTSTIPMVRDLGFVREKKALVDYSARQDSRQEFTQVRGSTKKITPLLLPV